MKKILIAFAVLAAALTSCVQEKSFDENVVGENGIAFVLQTSPSTRSADMEAPVRKGVRVPIGQVGDLGLFLEETVSYLDYSAPETRGTPVYTQNVGTIFKDKLFVHAAGFGDATFETIDQYENQDSNLGMGWRYHHNYLTNLWPTDGSPVDFYLVMPVDMIASDPEEGAPQPVGITGLDYRAGGSIAFNYLSPLSATAQQDILFTSTNLTEEQHRGYLPNGAPVLFYHALTAVKFAVANDSEEISDMGITVTGISFTGLKNAGSCTVNPNATGTSPKVVWNSSAAEGNVISQAFTAENLVTYSQEGDENGFAESFFSSGTVQNVNDASASFTFWLIPQAFAGSEAVLRISYTMSGKAEYMDLALGDILKSVTWEAGELRTYTIKLDNVNVMIEDQVNIPEDGSATADNGYEGSTKEDVTITNTGTTPVYIRVAIVGQWLDSNNNPVFGFTDKLNQLYQVESWYQDQFVKPDPGVQGKFVGLPGYKGASTFKASEDDPTVGWQLCTDRYYYYTDVVYPDATTSELFESYTVMQIPDAQLGGIPVDQRTMHFELEIAAQAVSAVKTDGVEGSLYSWKEAWTRTSASGKTPVEK